MDLAPVTRTEPRPDGAQPVGQVRSWRRPAVGAGLVVAFVGLAVVVESGWLAGVDRSVLRWTAQHRTGALETVAGAIVTLATPQLLILATLAVGAWQIGARRSRAVLIGVAVRLGLLVLSVVALKNVLARPSPPLHASFDYTPLDTLAHMTQFGEGGAFPSGHTTTTIVCVAVLLGLAGAGSRVRRFVLVGAVAAVSASLVYMGFHWFSDVVGAWLLGSAILAVPVPAVPSRDAGAP
ncbi:MAG TPA: phosphatase PAP2 family protein [Jatrophihabitans sp.]|nr:phosphatase PAP2 family protein [Jatrophihabitans sp.]